jgi:hypothetical protein
MTILTHFFFISSDPPGDDVEMDRDHFPMPRLWQPRVGSKDFLLNYSSAGREITETLLNLHWSWSSFSFLRR